MTYLMIKPWKFIYLGYFDIYEQLKFRTQLSWEWKKFHNLGARPRGYKTFFQAQLSWAWNLSCS